MVINILSSNNYNNLKNDIINCHQCQRLVDFREKIAREKRKSYLDWNYWGKPIHGFGKISSKLLILGLAPAAHGANRTGRVFTGDKSADFLFNSLHQTEFANQRESVSVDDGLELNAFMTVAVKCVPPGDKPLAIEKENCSKYLSREVGFLSNLKMVLGLGKIGFESYLRFVRKDYNFKLSDYPFKHGEFYRLPNNIILVGSYHPSPRNVNTNLLTSDMMNKLLNDIKKEI